MTVAPFYPVSALLSGLIVGWARGEGLFRGSSIVGVGTKLETREYKRCTGNAKKLTELLEKLIPRHERLMEFTKAMAPSGIPITKWNNRVLIEHSGKVSKYLHWSGGLDETTQSSTWYENGIFVVETAAIYIWRGLTTGNTGVMTIKTLEPEMRELWNLYANNQITLENAVKRAEILEPILQARITQYSTEPTQKTAQSG